MYRLLTVLLLATLSSLVASLVIGDEKRMDVAKSQGVLSFLGETLMPTPLAEARKAEMESKLALAQADFEADPEGVDSTIWLGRRLAYLGRYADAIEVYSQGILRHPEEARLYRHRGHRYITTRQLGKAIEDLERAAQLIAGRSDVVEPDGLPNERGIPTSTLHSNIWYHLGLARYLAGDFAGALVAYEACLEVSKNPDMLVATSHWLYMTLRRSGETKRAAEILAPITADMDVIENHEYQRLLLLYRGELPLEDLWPPRAAGLAPATLGYGIGNWHLYNGRPAEATSMFEAVLRGNQWAAFGYLAAEAEVARSQGRDLR